MIYDYYLGSQIGSQITQWGIKTSKTDKFEQKIGTRSQKWKVRDILMLMVGVAAWIRLQHRVSSWSCVLRVPGWRDNCPGLALTQPESSSTSELEGTSGSRSVCLLRRIGAYSMGLPISWNKIPIRAVTAPTFNSFKRLLDTAWNLWPSALGYDPTFFSI